MTTEHTAAPAQSVAQPPILREAWWVEPLLTVLFLGFFSLYSFWSIVIATKGWEFGSYLSPFYSPLLSLGFWPFSPALLIFWMPLGFRATCYYYRKAYWRSFFLDPPACAVRDPGILAVGSRGYVGERRFPEVLLNSHRFFLYLALVVLFFLWVDAIRAFSFDGRFGIGLGSLIFLTNVLLLSGYTFSCHSLRHLVGGGMDCMSCSRGRYTAWEWLSAINPRHSYFAWASLFSVVLTDVYVRLLSSGALTDVRFL